RHASRLQRLGFRKELTKMSCCGQKRVTMTTQSTRSTLERPPIPTPDPSQWQGRALSVPAPTMLRHTGTGVLALRGPSTGWVDLFSDREAIAVLPEDVDVLLRIGALERASP